MRIKIILISIMYALFLYCPAWSEETEVAEPAYQEFIQSFKKPYFHLSMLLQVVGNFQDFDDPVIKNGFSISTMRFRVKGKLDKGFKYFFQTNLANTFSILDAYFSYEYASYLTFDMGLMKAPFSQEFLIYAADIDFVNRARIVNLLAPKREIGFQIRGAVINNLIIYSAGIFNGNGFNVVGNDNDQFLYSGRLSFTPAISSSDKEHMEIGAGFASSNDNYLFPDALPAINKFNGKRILYEADFRLVLNNLLFAGEYIYGQFHGSFNEQYDKKSLSGYHLTIGYMIWEKVQFLSRLDNVNFSIPFEEDNHLIFGLNILPSKVVSFQINYILDLENNFFQKNQLLINAQLSI